jgi:hypothetical protein
MKRTITLLRKVLVTSLSQNIGSAGYTLRTSGKICVHSARGRCWSRSVQLANMLQPTMADGQKGVPLRITQILWGQWYRRLPSFLWYRSVCSRWYPLPIVVFSVSLHIMSRIPCSNPGFNSVEAAFQRPIGNATFSDWVTNFCDSSHVPVIMNG